MDDSIELLLEESIDSVDTLNESVIVISDDEEIENDAPKQFENDDEEIGNYDVHLDDDDDEVIYIESSDEEMEIESNEDDRGEYSANNHF